MCEYLIFAPGNRAFVAFPVCTSRVAISLIPASTRKKALVKAALSATRNITIPFPAFFYRNDIEIFPGLTISSLAGDLGVSELSPERVLILWNRDIWRQRAYIWFYDGAGVTHVFAKVCIGDEGRLALRTERATLAFLQGRSLGFLVPRAVRYWEKGEYTVLVTTAIPAVPFKVLPWKMVKSVCEELLQLRARVVSGGYILTKRWFRTLRDHISPRSFKRIGEILQAVSVETGLVHGDFGSENIFVNNDSLWVIDWEKSSDEGPVLTDRIAHWLGGRPRRESTARVVSAFQRYFSAYRPEDVLLGVVYLVSVKFPPAEAILRSWNATEFGILK